MPTRQNGCQAAKGPVQDLDFAVSACHESFGGLELRPSEPIETRFWLMFFLLGSIEIGAVGAWWCCLAR